MLLIMEELALLMIMFYMLIILIVGIIFLRSRTK